MDDPTQTSPGLWALAWRRLRADKVAMIALAIVAAFLLTIALSSSGFIAADWEQETGVSYAPPSFTKNAENADKVQHGTAAGNHTTTQATVTDNPLDPLRDIIKSLRQQENGTEAVVVNDYGIQDPIGAEMSEIRTALAKSGKAKVTVRATTLPFGADKWGHDIIKKPSRGQRHRSSSALSPPFWQRCWEHYLVP